MCQARGIAFSLREERHHHLQELWRVLRHCWTFLATEGLVIAMQANLNHVTHTPLHFSLLALYSIRPKLIVV